MMSLIRNKDFWRNFINALATAASMATLITFLCDWKAKEVSPWILVVMAVGILALSILYGYLMIRRKDKIELKFNPSFKMTIKYGNLFDPTHDGIIVIPVNQYFDTQLEGSLVSRDSVLGTFITKIWQNRVDELDRKIESGLPKVGGVENPSRSAGKKVKYDLGTCVKLLDGGKIYVLVVTTEKNEDNQTVLSKKDYPIVIGELFNYLKTISKTHIIYMPLFGAGRGRMTRSRQRILSFLIDTLDFKYSDLSFPKGVNIIIKDGYKDDINLNIIENHFDKALKD